MHSLYDNLVDLKLHDIEEFEKRRKSGNFLYYRDAVHKKDQKLIELLECPSAIESIETQKLYQEIELGLSDNVFLFATESNKKANNYLAFSMALRAYLNFKTCQILHSLEANNAAIDRINKFAIKSDIDIEIFDSMIVKNCFHLNDLRQLLNVYRFGTLSSPEKTNLNNRSIFHETSIKNQIFYIENDIKNSNNFDIISQYELRDQELQQRISFQKRF